MNTRQRGVALVSGGGSGLGRACALALARRGHRLALVGRRPEPLAAVLAEAGGEGCIEPLDVRDGAAVADAVRRVETSLGPVDLVLPAAGIASVAPFAEQPAEEFEAQVAVNLLGCANLLRAALPSMLARRRGDLVAILSVAARRTFPGWSGYAASKWGLLGLVESLREELAGSGLRVLALTPGATDSPLWDGLPGHWERERMMPADEVARALIWALEAERAVVEEVRLRPPGGDL